ncbi:flagellar motor protein MotB [Nocardioides sp.]|uniref:flagellar motor protein MotB n=1 Tax=Nocardioides sp. TaxID=35761 RepID=UPI002736FE9F|nr:flagellar motor protein MotB [Nocardioides sp.]MDP3890251.1 flagellar motor protein MotB [Nocardioides sp.]
MPVGNGRGGRGRRVPAEEHENHERWLVSYADMITVLMALFIVLYAMSQVDESKYQELKQSLRAGFGERGAMIHNSSSVLDGPGQTALSAIVPVNELDTLTTEERVIVDNAVARTDQLRRQRQEAEVRREADRLAEILRRLREALRRHDLEEDVRTSIDHRGLVLSLVSRHVVFDADLATLTARGRLVVDTLAPVLRDLPDPLQIDGHTNQVDVKPRYFPSDWDLSAARAITVLRHLHESGGVPNDRMAATAYGMEKPLVDPRRRGSQQINKRVDIVVLTSLPPETRALLDEIGVRHSMSAANQGGTS